MRILILKTILLKCQMKKIHLRQMKIMKIGYRVYMAMMGLPDLIQFMYKLFSFRHNH